MKRILAGALAALLTFSAYATTFVPPALINPAGSTSGQVVTSTGPTTSAGWATVTPSGIGGLAKASNLSDVASATAALTNLGGLSSTTAASTYATITNLALKAALAGSAFTGPVSGTTFTATGLITPSSAIGIKATATNDSVQAGSIGESPACTSLSSVALTSGSPANVGSCALGAGDWLVWGTVQFIPAATTPMSGELAGVSQTSATFGALGSLYNTPITYAAGLGSITPPPTPMVHIKLASSATVFLVAQAFFTVSTCAASGFIVAIRPR